jgi:uncharacterized membrane protein YjfL (UPF0719 family)
MSGDEVLALFAAAVAALILGVRWYAAVCGAGVLARNAGQRRVMAVWPLVCLMVLLAVLLGWSDPVVRNDGAYLFLFLVLGAAWQFATLATLPVLGLSPRDDAIDRRNPAATVAICGALLGAMLCFAGGNIGRGPTIWTTIVPAALATGLWFVLWMGWELTTRGSEPIVIDRDLAAGIRLGGFLTAAGLVLGGSAAGDWQSLQATLVDLFEGAAAAAVLGVGAVLAHRFTRPTPDRPVAPVVSSGVIVAAGYLVAAGAWVALRR